MTAQKIVIIGGVAAGPKAAARARRLDPDADITIIERGEVLSYAGCGMPYCIKGNIETLDELLSTPVGVPRDEVYFKRVKGIKVLHRTLATAIDREKKTVETVHISTTTRKKIAYDTLVLATGGLPFVPPIENIDLNNVFKLNHPNDAMALQNAVTSKKVKKATIIGGGLIGIEVTEALAANNIDVDIVEMLDWVLPGLLDFECAAFLEKHLCSQGVKIHTSEKVLKLEGDSRGNVSKVITNKHEFDTDLVLIAVGVRPNVSLAKEAGLVIGERGGIIVDEHLRTNDPDIYAGGDCVENYHIVTGEKCFVPMGSTANKHGRIIADNIMGKETTFPGIVGTSVVKVFDYNVGKSGLTEKDARARGYDVVTALIPAPDRAHYYPEGKPILVKLVAERDTGRILGGQVVGPGDAIKRVDVLVTALRFQATYKDLRDLDLGYAPPYSAALDPLAHAANTIENKIHGVAKSVTPMEVKAMIDEGEEFVWLDVRTQKEFEELAFENERVTLIPIGKLRERLEELPDDKKIVTFCKVSLRGYCAQCILAGAGFDDVAFMDGGILAWPYDLHVE